MGLLVLLYGQSTLRILEGSFEQTSVMKVSETLMAQMPRPARMPFSHYSPELGILKNVLCRSHNHQIWGGPTYRFREHTPGTYCVGGYARHRPRYRAWRQTSPWALCIVPTSYGKQTYITCYETLAIQILKPPTQKCYGPTQVGQERTVRRFPNQRPARTVTE